MNAYETLHKNLKPLDMEFVDSLIQNGFVYTGDTTGRKVRAVLRSEDTELLIDETGKMECRLRDGFNFKYTIDIKSKELLESNLNSLLFVAGYH